MYLDIYVYIVAVMIFMCPMLSVLRSPRPHFLSPGICILYQMVGCWTAGRWSAEQLGSPGVTIRELIARTELTLDRLELHGKKM